MISYSDFILEMATPSPEHRTIEWYHGTKDITGILETKTIKPGNTTDVKSLKTFTPQFNRSYLTADIDFALVYAFGGHLSNSTPYNKQAYICVISGNDLADINPDEDIIADLAQQYFRFDRKTYSFQFREALEKEKSDDSKHSQELFEILSYMQRNISYDAFIKINNDWGYGTRIGKFLIKKMPDYMKHKLINLKHTRAIANEGEAPVSEIWQLDISKYAEIKADSSNFRNYAKRIL